MVPASLPRPDLAAHRETLRLPAAVIIKRLVELVGRKLTAYIGGARDVHVIDEWLAGGLPDDDTDQRLRVAFQLISMLSEHEDTKVVKAWLIGLNPELGDHSPLRLLREVGLRTAGPNIMGAARNFLVSG